MPDPARIAQAQVLEIPVTIQGETAVDETGRREPFAESAKTALTFDNGAVLKLQARVTPGESVSLRNEQSGKEIQCKVLEAPAEGQLGYTDLEFVESVPDFWEDHAEHAEVAVEKAEARVSKSDAESAEKPDPGAMAAEPKAAANAEPAAEKHEPAQPEAVVAEPETATSEAEGALKVEAAAEKPEEPAPTAEPEAVVAQPEAHANQETEAAAENSLAMMSATASEVKLPPAQVPAPEEKPEAPKRQGRLREELVPAHEMVPETPPAPVAPATPPAASATEPTGEQIDAALRKMEDAAVHPQSGAEPNDAKDQANLAALMTREARLAKYAALKEKAAAQIGRIPAAPGASKGAEGAEGEAGANVEGEVEAGPPKLPLSERLTTGKNALIVEIVAGVAIVAALGFVWHAVRGLIIRPTDRPAAVAAASAKKAAPPVIVQTPAAPVAQAPALTPPAPGNAPAAQVTAAKPSAPINAPAVKVAAATPSVAASAPAAKATAPRPAVVASAPATKVVEPSPARSEAAEDDGPRVVEPPPVNAEPEPVASVAPKAAENVPAKIVSAPQPGFPSWAKTLDVGSVVRLDAVIDEKGNLGQTKIVSGPRLLERAAEQAVQLWIFEPAQLHGKPAATHLVLTVEFQR